jgi:predicted dehydrogenase
MQKEPIRLGIIGCGIATRKLHWPALQRLRDYFQIVVVCNHTEPKARSFAELVGGVDYVLDYRELLERRDVEAVLIALPIYLNYAVTRDALQAGKHVMVEKPLAANLDEARQMLLLDRTFVPVKMVAENFRYRSTFAKIQDLMNEGTIGRPYAVFWNVFLDVRPSTNPYAGTQWRQKPQHVGGFITDGGVHNVNALRYWFGEFLSGFAYARSVNPEIGKPDSFQFSFQMESGVSGALNIFLSSRGHMENRLLILGETGAITVRQNQVTVRKQDGAEYSFEQDDDGGYTEQLLHFYRAIRYGEPVQTTFEEAYRDLAVLVYALKGAEKGEVVAFSSRIQEDLAGV